MGEYIHEEIFVNETLPAQINIIEAGDSHVMPLHWHRSLELDYMVEVDAKAIINGRVSTLRPGDLVVVNSGEIHCFEVLDASCQKVVDVIISYDFLKRICKDLDSYIFRVEGHQAEADSLAMAMKSLYYLRKDGRGQYRYLKENEILYHILYLLFTYFRVEKKGVPEAETEKFAERFKIILEYINEHYKDNIGLDMTAEYYGISREHLSRSFHKYMGITFKEYLDRVRMKHAFPQYIHSDRSVLDIALMYGFSDDRAFTRCFKQIYGKTPSQYKKDAVIMNNNHKES